MLVGTCRCLFVPVWCLVALRGACLGSTVLDCARLCSTGFRRQTTHDRLSRTNPRRINAKRRLQSRPESRTSPASAAADHVDEWASRCDAAALIRSASATPLPTRISRRPWLAESVSTSIPASLPTGLSARISAGLPTRCSKPVRLARHHDFGPRHPWFLALPDSRARRMDHGQQTSR